MKPRTQTLAPDPKEPRRNSEPPERGTYRFTDWAMI